jgi:adenosylcobinamide kinase/adenosylcobinamide-phosphate guanylyltransferase
MNKRLPKLVLITGGVRSGKSTFAQNIAENFGKKITFIATAQALDKEMKERIAKHKANRPKHWETHEEPYQVAKVISRTGQGSDVIVIDCLGLLVSNLMQDYQEKGFNNLLADNIIKNIQEIVAEALKCPATVIIVSNEVGLGLVPENAMGRFFRDILGQANQLIATNADRVYLMVTGIPLLIKENNDEKHS